MSSGEEGLSTRHACAACKHQRKKCESTCVFAPHFPASRANQFKEVHKIFGVKNMTGILENLNEEQKIRAVQSLEWEAIAWKEDPIEGPLGRFRKLEKELEFLKNQQIIAEPYNLQSKSNALIRFNPGSAEDVLANGTNPNCTDLGFHNPNFASALDATGNHYGAWLARGHEIENQVGNCMSTFPYYQVHPGQGRSMMVPQEEGMDAVAQTSNLLPKQDTQMTSWPVANSLNQGRPGRGIRGRDNFEY
ncbi:hypothetical protein PTKIN_Ptkin18bG0117100 [Pterospermum kingtungense]